ncbi:hypothetical protein [Mycolicibacterium diernhoferi]|uniref:Uncharacterized protein n=1 Tax=Mycolicibacterium diernhoferi TaxID=1801 RepID=A0A1Q4HFR0_9MYCO|nr:hypothetical protein BRW64_08525 [Mycolicibacterium diernhoferi]OPE50483.1 hypothetical protein BV510_20920 [Mycolicibacterium diernhoferi]PEG54122.1 hypothetical protein CRI78_12285 [Mycolicibacterium diernhoferi]QYL24490.1 hypothetical protein K0O62_09680 [Mycolicibacterium diernhoferi]
MSVSVAETAFRGLSDNASAQWWDRESESTLVLSTPTAEPELWDDFIEGALRSYRKHGVERAIDPSTLVDPAATSLFLAAVDDAGHVVGGVRTQGPYREPEESHALVEWAGQDSLPLVRKMIEDRLPFGVVEVKTAWSDDRHPHSRALASVLARMPLHATFILGAKFAMATAAAHVLDRWRSSGGVVATRIPATPYPDERYETKMMWWDQAEFTRTADPQQIIATRAETRVLLPLLEDIGGLAGAVQAGV